MGRVEKYRSVEEMNRAPVARSSSSDFERFLRHCARYRAIAPRAYSQGVVRFRTLEEAQAARERVARGLPPSATGS